MPTMYFHHFIFTISFKSPLGKGRGPSLDQTWILVTRWCDLFEIGPVVRKKNIFKILSVYFRYFNRYKIPFLTNLNPLHTRMSWFKLGWNWPSGSGGESVKCVQTDGQTDRQTDDLDRRSEKLNLPFSSYVSDKVIFFLKNKTECLFF